MELKYLEEIAKPKKKGAKPSFSVVDIIRMIRLVGKAKIIARATIAKELGVGEGIVRTLIRHLKEKKIINVIRAGVTLTEEGLRIFEIFDEKIIYEDFIPKNILQKLSLGTYNYLLLAKSLAEKVGKGIEERDIAVKHGTKALITLTLKEGKITFPDGYPLNEEYKDFVEFLKEKFGRTNALVIISCSEDPNSAIRGAYSVLYYLIKEERNNNII